MLNARSLRVGALVAAAALSLTACANYAASPSTSAAGSASASAGSAAAPALVTAGKLTVCTHLSYKPFQFKDDANKIVGFDVDLMDVVAKKLNATQEIVDISFDQITAGVAFAAKKCDIGAAAITITDARKEAVDFTVPYFDATQALLVKDAAITDAGINDNGVVYDYAKDNPTTKVTKEFATGEQYGFDVAKGNTALLTVANEALTAAKADGTYNTIYKKWFGVDAPK